MNHERLQHLVARYDAAESTLAEEQELRALLRASDLPKAYLPYRALFGATQVLAKAQPTMYRAGPWDQPAKLNGQPAKVVPLARKTSDTLQRPAPRTRRTARMRTLRLVSLAAAAVVLVALAVSLLRHADTAAPEAQPIASAQTIDWSKYEVTDVDEAKRITAAALGTVTRNIDQSGRITSREVGRMHPIRHTIKL